MSFLQFLGLDLFNIKLSAKFYQNIPNALRVNFHFFSEFEPRQYLGISQMSFDNLMGYILSIYQCVCKITSQYTTQFKKQGHFHFFRIWSSAKPRPMKNDISHSLGLDLDNIRGLSKYSTQFKRSGDFHFFRILRSAKPRPMINVILQ